MTKLLSKLHMKIFMLNYKLFNFFLVFLWWFIHVTSSFNILFPLFPVFSLLFVSEDYSVHLTKHILAFRSIYFYHLIIFILIQIKTVCPFAFSHNCILLLKTNCWPHFHFFEISDWDPLYFVFSLEILLN